MKAPGDGDGWLGPWRQFAERVAAGEGSAAAGRASLEQAGAAFARFAEEFAALGRPPDAAAAARAEYARQLNALAERFVSASFPPWPAPAGADPGFARALEAWARVQAAIAADAARRFAARLVAPDAPTTLRATFDAWIEAAEAAFQSHARSDAFVAAQARLLNEFVAQRARQQALLERAARAAGMPTRAEVDALYDELRALSRPAGAAADGTAPSPQRAAKPRPAAPPRPRSRPGAKRPAAAGAKAGGTAAARARRGAPRTTGRRR